MCIAFLNSSFLILEEAYFSLLPKCPTLHAGANKQADVITSQA
jgi:hypothetical protein